MQAKTRREVAVIIGAAFVLTLSLSAQRAQARPCYTNPTARARGINGETVLCVAVGQSVSLTAVYSGAYSYDPDNGVPYPGRGITDYDWDMSDGAYLDGSSIVHEYAEPGEYGVLLRVWDDDPYPYRAFDDEWITVWVVAVNVNAGLTEEGEENPGLYINVNWSDDDGDGWEPNEDPPGATYKGDKDDDEIGEGGDDDFRVFSVHVDPEQAPVTVVVQFQNNIKVWRTFTKKMEGGGTSEVVSGTGYDPQNIPWPLLIEGQSGTQDFRGVSLTATVKYGQNQICSDTVRVTVFEVDLDPLFAGEQSPIEECDKRFTTLRGSSDMRGKISWDDKDGDGVPEGEGDYDTNCVFFANCMECRGTIKPAGVTDQVVFDLTREAWGRAWWRFEGEPWALANERVPWESDDTFQNDEDLTPYNNHIYMLDGPGLGFRERSQVRDYVLFVADFREWALVSIMGQMRQCSDIQKWHHQLYLKPKDAQFVTRHDAALQKLGEGWILVPNAP